MCQNWRIKHRSRKKRNQSKSIQILKHQRSFRSHGGITIYLIKNKTLEKLIKLLLRHWEKVFKSIINLTHQSQWVPQFRTLFLINLIKKKTQVSFHLTMTLILSNRYGSKSATKCNQNLKTKKMTKFLEFCFQISTYLCHNWREKIKSMKLLCYNSWEI